MIGVISLHKLLKRGIALVVVAAVAGGGFYAYRRSNSPALERPTGNPRDSLVSEVSTGDIINTITASGTVMLNNEVEVYAEGETNKVKEFHVEEGDTVTAGQLLVTYDTDDSVEELENKIRDTNREIENAQLNLQSLEMPTTDSELQRLQNEVTSSENSLKEAQNNVTTINTQIQQQQTEIANAKKDWEDAQKTVSDNAQLLKVGGITQSEYDTSVTECERAQQTYNNSIDSLDSLNIQLESAEMNVTTAQNNLEVAKTSLDEAVNKLDLEETQIQIAQQELTLQGLNDTLSDAQKDLNDIVYSTYAPVDGVVTEVCIDEGTYTEENTVMLKIADLNDLIVTANIEEYDAPLLELGQSVTMTSDGLEDKVYTGEITKINITASNADSNMGSETVVPIEISVDNPDGILKQNYNLDLEIVTSDSSGVLCVPSSAVGTDAKSNESYVYKVENDVLKRTVVETGETDETNIEITSGLNEGDTIVSSISGNMTDGMSLDELSTAAPAANQNSEEGNNDDRNQGSDQMLPSGGFGGAGAGGNMPPGGGR